VSPAVRTADAPLGEELLDELRDLVMLHARAQGLDPAHCRELLGRIGTSSGFGTGSWAGVWCEEGNRLADRGRYLDACRHYALGRFPYADGPGRARAQERCVEAFDHWRAGRRGIERLTVELPGGTVHCWAAGLSAAAPRPLLLVIGGIVSVKEQWGPLLAAAPALGMAVVVTEMPGVGENTLPYDDGSPAMVTAVLDAVADRADAGRTHAVALSFGGHLALRCALADRRVRGVATVGAPLGPFFLDRAWQEQVPGTTVATLSHLTGTGRRDVFESLRERALTAGELGSLDVSVAYVASLRDEIVPLADVALLRRTLARSEALVLDDVHGAPLHLDRVRPWLLGRVLRMAGADRGRRAAFGAAHTLARARLALRS
jgi:esterase FrsA